MKITAPGIVPDASPAGARSSPAYALQWRKALEEAQWQARQRIAPREAGRSDGGAQAPDVVADVAAGGAAMTDSTPVPIPVRPESTQSAARSEALAAAVARAIETATPPVRAAVQPPVAAPSAVRGEDLSTTAAPSSETDEPQHAQPLYQLPEWPDVVVHASVQGSTISVGMRDRAVQKNDALDLYYRLRGQLRGAGLELTSLTVNGHNVTAADAASRNA